MFKLIKLGIYALIGYAIYEFAQGVMEGHSDEGGSTVQSAAGRSAVRSGGQR